MLSSSSSVSSLEQIEELADQRIFLPSQGVVN